MIRLFTILFALNLVSGFAQESGNDGRQRSMIQNLCDLEALKSYNPISGTVPLSFGHMPSTDLLCDSDECGGGFEKGDVLSPKQAAIYYKRRFNETRCQWTLADLEPKEEPSIWRNQIGAPVNPRLDNLPVNDMDKVDFVSEGWARLGSYRVTVNKNNSYGTPIQYTLILSKNVHTYLLRKALLRKLGYIVPPIKHVKRLKIRFNSNKEKENFIGNIKLSASGSFDRWILSEKRKELVLQDIVVMEDQEFKLNLAKGYVSADIFQGKRVFDSLLIPYALTEFTQSVNMIPWTVGRIYSENVILNFPDSKEYSVSKDDAVWMARRILKLTHKDWEEIVEATSVPESVKMLMLEKLKSGRNHLGTLFGIDNKNLPVNHVISNHDDLEDGKLTKEFYDGYARRFKIPDPESPLAYSDMQAFFKSKAITVGLELLMNTFNSAKFLGTDLNGKIEDFYDSLSEDLADTVSSGNNNKLPVKAYAFPTVRGNLILNRDIVTGSYLGTDNIIQLVDTVGASVSGGVFGGVSGIYAKTGQKVPVDGNLVRQSLPVDLYGNASVFLNRTYSHVKPITSVQKALKYPFKNMMVPLLKRKYGNYFSAIMTADYDKLSDTEKVVINKSSYKKLTAAVGVISSKITNFADKYKTEKLMSAIEQANTKLTGLQNTYETSIVQNEAVSQAKLALETLQAQITNTYVTYATCRKDAVEKLNKQFSIVEREIKETDENGEEVVTGTEQVICAADRKGRVDKNITVVLSQSTAAISEVSYQAYRLAKKQRDYEISEITALLDENLEVGESLIVQDSIGGALTATVGMSLYNIAKVKASVKGNKLVVNRLHIHRKSETEIHIYKDLGNVNGIELAMSIEKYVPIMKITVKGIKGKARTKFYKVNIAKKNNELLVDNLKGLRNAFLTGSVATLEAVKKPFTIVHKFDERNAKLGLLVFRWNWLKQQDNLVIKSPEGHEKKAYRQVKGYTKGTDYENYTRDLVDLFFAKLTDTNFSISSFNEGNPGFTYMGKAQNRITSYEGVYNDKGELERPFTKLTRVWNGWKMDHKKAIKTLKKIKKKYGFKFFEEQVLAQTKKIFLYNINVNFFVYNEGLKSMLSISESKLEKIWKHNQSRDMTNFNGSDSLKRSGFKKFLRLRAKYSKFLLKNDQKRYVRKAIEMVELLEEKLKVSGIKQVLGGGNNFFAIARIDGFRVGDEDGDRKLISNSLGRTGSENLKGPLNELRDFIGISNGEFYISWLLGRVL